MGACATKPKTLEGKTPEEVAPISTPKVAPETTAIPNEVAAEQVIVQKVVEEAKEDPTVVEAAIELPTNAEPEQKAEVITPEAINEPEQMKEEVVEKIVVEEEKPSAPTEEKTAAAEVAVETSEEKKDTEETSEEKKDAKEEKEKPTQS